MAKDAVAPTGPARTFGENEIIVSKTDLKGRIAYANDIFLKVADFTEAEVLGPPHAILRHPDMPRAVFKMLWDAIEAKREIFSYIRNMTKHGDHYWVFAHVTPSLDARGAIIGYHSNRRSPTDKAVASIEPIYKAPLAEETRHANAKDGLAASERLLSETIAKTGRNRSTTPSPTCSSATSGSRRSPTRPTCWR